MEDLKEFPNIKFLFHFTEGLNDYSIKLNKKNKNEFYLKFNERVVERYLKIFFK